MACGTGKMLTALWIAERLQSSLTLVLVPSLSLVQQNLAEWGRHSTQDFDTLVVCSDESVVISVTDREAKAWAERATLVRTAEGLSTDARTLAAQIGLAKAMRKYDLRKLITFHSSVAKAARFVDATRRDSLPGVITHMTSFVVPPSGGTKRRTPPKGGTTNLNLWTKHISGHTPAGQRATLLNFRLVIFDFRLNRSRHLQSQIKNRKSAWRSAE
jgi:hypothetical protein